jgi:glycosyltransferase involved in cell wall biosynthesis
MKSITVFTPTFNRAYCLSQLYASLVMQTSTDFLWLVIDDGSTDTTKNLVDFWIAEDKISIQYIYKNNEGMHSGHNVAIKNITTELNMCIDSDDYLSHNAIEKVLSFWKNNKKESWAGIIGLDAFKDGTVVGTPFPQSLLECKYSLLKSRYKVTGDKKFIYKTAILKKYPEYPIFEDEKFVPLGYKYLLIDQDYDLGVLHEILCVVEYMPDGSSKNIIKQYLKNPKGFAHERKIRMQFAPSFKERFTNAVHYVSSLLLLKNYRFLKESPNKVLTLVAIPFGILLNIYIRYTNKSGIMK